MLVDRKCKHHHDREILRLKSPVTYLEAYIEAYISSILKESKPVPAEINQYQAWRSGSIWGRDYIQGKVCMAKRNK
jgi:hypothetical protein